jgi:hypothetical protein
VSLWAFEKPESHQRACVRFSWQEERKGYGKATRIELCIYICVSNIIIILGVRFREFVVNIRSVENMVGRSEPPSQRVSLECLSADIQSIEVDQRGRLG